MKTYHEAETLLKEYTKQPSLIKHARCVEIAMRWYAAYYQQPPEEVEKWAITGLLHDFDYDSFPNCDPTGHPYQGNRILTEQDWPQDIRDAIMGHAQFTGVPRETLMAKTLFAVDELSGFIVAAALIRPDKSLLTLTPKSVKKRMKDKAFARACNREEMIQGAEELGIDLTEHIDNVITALQSIADELDLTGRSDT